MCTCVTGHMKDVGGWALECGCRGASQARHRWLTEVACAVERSSADAIVQVRRATGVHRQDGAFAHRRIGVLRRRRIDAVECLRDGVIA